MKYLFYILFFQVLFNISCYSQNNKNKPQEIILVDEICKDKINDTCKCSVKRFNCDKLIYLTKTEPDFSFNFEKLPLCNSLDLQVYNKKISLDSVYRNNIQNKQLPYWGEFYNGTYLIDKNVIILDLFFLNPAINTSKSTSHNYKIIYDLKKKSIEKLVFKFIDE